MSVNNPDFAARSGLASTDLVFWYLISWPTIGANTDSPAPMSIRKQAAGILCISNSNTWLDLSGQGQPAVASPGNFLISSNWSPFIGLELEADVTPHSIATIINAQMMILVLRRRRRLESLPGQV